MESLGEVQSKQSTVPHTLAVKSLCNFGGGGGGGSL